MNTTHSRLRASLAGLVLALLTLPTLLATPTRAQGWDGPYYHNVGSKAVSPDYGGNVTASIDDWTTGCSYGVQVVGGDQASNGSLDITSKAYYYWDGPGHPDVNSLIKISDSCQTTLTAMPDYEASSYAENVPGGTEYTIDNPNPDNGWTEKYDVNNRKHSVKVRYGTFPDPNVAQSGSVYYIEDDAPGAMTASASFAVGKYYTGMGLSADYSVSVQATEGINVTYANGITIIYDPGSGQVVFTYPLPIGVGNANGTSGPSTIQPILNGSGGNNPTSGSTVFTGPVFTHPGSLPYVGAYTDNGDGTMTLNHTSASEYESASNVVRATYTDPDGYTYSADFVYQIADRDFQIQTEYGLGNPFSGTTYSTSATFNNSVVSPTWTYTTTSADPTDDINISSGTTAGELDFTKQSYNVYGGGTTYSTLSGTATFTDDGTTYSRSYSF